MHFVDKYESNHTGDGQTDGQTRTEVCTGWIPGWFNLSGLFTKTKMPGNTSHNFIDSIFSNKESPIGDIEKA